MRLDRINFAVIQDYIAEKLASGLSKKSINNYLTVLRRSLGWTAFVAAWRAATG